MSKKIELRVLLDYNDLDTVIEQLIKLREEHGGDCMVDLETEAELYDSGVYVAANLIVPD